MKKLTKTMMFMGACAMCGMGAYMYNNKKTKKALKKYKSYLEN